MADRVQLAFRASFARLVPQGTHLLAAISGGGDSVALLHLLSRVAERRAVRVTVAHLDHGLRAGSRADRRFVESAAAAAGFSCRADRREVGALRRRDESPEEAARRVRREFLLEQSRQVGAECIATGHTLDDQAETVLMRWIRGAASAALAGMRETGPGPFVRPLLGLERAALREYLARHAMTHREDPSNADLCHDRARVRDELLPLIVERLNPRAARHIVQAAARVREDAEYLDALAQEAFARTGRSRDGAVSLDAVALLEMPPVLRRRVLVLALREAGSDARRIGARHVEALERLLTTRDAAAAHLPQRRVARRRGNRLRIAREPGQG